MDKEERNGSQPPVQPPGVKFSLSKPKVLGRRPPLPPKKEKTRGGREEDEEEEQEDVDYVTGFDEKLGLVGKDPERRRRGGVKVVPKLENSWRPEKRMKNIVMESDVTKLTEETFEMETMAAGPKPDVQYGLTVVTRVQEKTTTTQGVAAAAAAPPRRSSSFQEMEDQKLREDLSLLPEESSLERYEELPVEEFGEALLRGMGWEKGKPIGRNSKTTVAPVEYVRRQGRQGLGATPLPPKENNKKFIKPGETRQGQPHTSERVRPDLKLVERIRKKSGIVIGKVMSVIAGEHAGWRGEIISLGDRIGSRRDDVVVIKLARTGDEVVVSSTDLAEVGSLEEESVMDDDMHDARIGNGNASRRGEGHDPRSSGSRWHEDHRNERRESGTREDRREDWESRRHRQSGNSQENGERRTSREAGEHGRSQGRRDSKREHGTYNENQELYVAETREKRGGERREEQKDGIWEEGHTKGRRDEDVDDLRDEMDVEKEGEKRSNMSRDRRREEMHKHRRDWRR